MDMHFYLLHGQVSVISADNQLKLVGANQLRLVEGWLYSCGLYNKPRTSTATVCSKQPSHTSANGADPRPRKQIVSTTQDLDVTQTASIWKHPRASSKVQALRMYQNRILQCL